MIINKNLIRRTEIYNNGLEIHFDYFNCVRIEGKFDEGRVLSFIQAIDQYFTEDQLKRYGQFDSPLLA